MICRISELQYKEVVNITNGERYGFIKDLEMDTETGKIHQIIIPGKGRLWGLVGRNTDLTFSWSSIKRIGTDIILVDSSAEDISSQNNVR